MRLAVTEPPLPSRHSARRISSQLNARHRQAGVAFGADRDARLKRCETGTAPVAAQHWYGTGMAQLVILSGDCDQVAKLHRSARQRGILGIQVKIWIWPVSPAIPL